MKGVGPKDACFYTSIVCFHVFRWPKQLIDTHTYVMEVVTQKKKSSYAI